MDALVTDVQHRAAVAGLRGLGRSGLRVLAVGPRRTAAGLWSRLAAARALAPAPGSAGDRSFASAVARLADEHGPLVVYPSSEDAIEALLRARGELPESVRLPYPPSDAVDAIRDKRRLPALAAEAGLRAPATRLEITAGELATVSLSAPAVAKPATPAGGFRGAAAVGSADELRAWARGRRFPPEEQLLVQELVEGELVSLELVLDRDGRVVERFQQLAARTWPAAAGSISFATSVAADADLVDRAARMLSSAGYWGLAQLDVFASPDGPVVVDVNPRFYSCLPLALACGANLPAAWHAVTVGDRYSSSGAYEAGASYRWLEGDLLAAASGHPGRLLHRGPAPRAGAMWAGDDPLTASMLGIGIAGMRIGRLLSRGGDR